MAKLGRNERCPCGSGRKVKRCCGQRPASSIEDKGWVFLRSYARTFASFLRGFDESELDVLLDRMIELPVRHMSLQVRLPGIFGPELERLRAAMVCGTDLAEVVEAAAAVVDGPLVRAGLVLAAAELSQRDELDFEMLAMVVVDLARPTSVFVPASLIAALAVTLGRCPTPAGLVVAAR